MPPLAGPNALIQSTTSPMTKKVAKEPTSTRSQNVKGSTRRVGDEEGEVEERAMATDRERELRTRTKRHLCEQVRPRVEPAALPSVDSQQRSKPLPR
jgi:hypothetical protein